MFPHQHISSSPLQVLLNLPLGAQPFSPAVPFSDVQLGGQGGFNKASKTGFCRQQQCGRWIGVPKVSQGDIRFTLVAELWAAAWSIRIRFII